MKFGVLVERQRDRRGHVELRVAHHSGQDQRHHDVQKRADHEAREDSDRHVALRIAGFLGRRGDRVEADVGEEDDTGGAQDPADSEMTQLAGVGRNERVPVGGIDVADAEQDEENDDGHFDRDDPGVEGRRLFDADVADGRDGAHDEDRRQIDDRAGSHYGEVPRPLIERCAGEGRGNMQSHLVQQTDNVAGPTDGDSADREQVFEDQIPADEPRYPFTEGRVGVGVSTARHGNHRGKLGIAQSGKRAADACEDEGKRKSRPRVIRGRRSGQHEDAGADDAADPERRQGRRGQHTLELDTGGIVGLQIGDRLGRQQLVRHRTPGTELLARTISKLQKVDYSA